MPSRTSKALALSLVEMPFNTAKIVPLPIEAEGKDLTIAERQQLREEKSLPELEALHDWLVQTRAQTANGGGSAKALDYTLKRWASLIRYA